TAGAVADDGSSIDCERVEKCHEVGRKVVTRARTRGSRGPAVRAQIVAQHSKAIGKPLFLAGPDLERRRKAVDERDHREPGIAGELIADVEFAGANVHAVSFVAGFTVRAKTTKAFRERPRHTRFRPATTRMPSRLRSAGDGPRRRSEIGRAS